MLSLIDFDFNRRPAGGFRLDGRGLRGIHLKLVPTLRDQQMIQPDLAGFVDQHQRLLKFGLLHQMVQHRGFATAEKAGQQSDGNARLMGVVRHQSYFR